MKKKFNLKVGKLFSYDKETLDYKKVNVFTWGLFLLVLISFSSVVSFSVGRIMKLRNLSDYEKELLIIDLNMRDDFSQDKLIEMLKDLNVRYPYIALAQARIETGGYRSRIFKENHNLFGMKQANRRVNTAKGTQYNHAYYETWRESVYDYAFYQSRYLSKANSEEEYLYILGQSYAEASTYAEALKKEIEKNNLRSLFD
jgi:hypothetical protein